MNSGIKRVIFFLSVFIGLLIGQQYAQGQTAQIALDTYEEGPVWQIMTFRTAPGKTELHLKNIATIWEHQLKLAVEKGVLVDYKVLTKWSSGPDDWAAIDAETVDTPEFQERFDRLQATGTEFLGTVFAREVRLKPQ